MRPAVISLVFRTWVCSGSSWLSRAYAQPRRRTPALETQRRICRSVSLLSRQGELRPGSYRS
jgi:hypothetical protein